NAPQRIAQQRVMRAAPLRIVSPPAGRGVSFPKVHVRVSAVVRYDVFTENAVVWRRGRTLNRFPVVIRVIIKNHAAAATALKDDAVPSVSHYAIFNFVAAVPMVKLDSIVRTAIVASAGVMIVPPVFVRITEFRPNVRGTGTVGT